MAKPTASLQWKGTNVCLDFVCECGAQGHLDSYFANVVMCPMCGRKYGLINQLHLLNLSPGVELGKMIPAEIDISEQAKLLAYHEDNPKLIQHMRCRVCGDINGYWSEVYLDGKHKYVLMCLKGHTILGGPNPLPEWLTDEIIQNARPT